MPSGMGNIVTRACWEARSTWQSFSGFASILPGRRTSRGYRRSFSKGVWHKRPWLLEALLLQGLEWRCVLLLDAGPSQERVDAGACAYVPPAAWPGQLLSFCGGRVQTSLVN